MAAIIGLESDLLEGLCGQASDAGLVALANLNSPTQIVVSGDEAAVERLMELAGEAGAKRAIKLQVGAAFHSELMKPVQAQLAEQMERARVERPQGAAGRELLGRCRERRSGRQAGADRADREPGPLGGLRADARAGRLHATSSSSGRAAC